VALARLAGRSLAALLTEDRGWSEDKAEEIAPRTVNKERAEAGETKTPRRQS
jgi:hypothetical protein